MRKYENPRHAHLFAGRAVLISKHYLLNLPIMTQSKDQELAKSFEPADIEARWYPIWEERGYFRAGTDTSKPGFAIQLPPPNITGILHMGHAFNQTVMDTLTRFHRMDG